jgi:long-subunit fatty acid transport protein
MKQHNYEINEQAVLVRNNWSLEFGIELQPSKQTVLRYLQYLINDRATITPHLNQIQTYLKNSNLLGDTPAVWQLLHGE